MAFLSTKLPWNLAQTKWASLLNPIIESAILTYSQVNNVALTASKPLAINHLLGRMPLGWFIVDKDSNAVVWRTSPYTNTTITLESDVDTNISLYVY